MSNVRLALPKPEIRGVGTVLYRCAGCGAASEPETQVVIDGRSYHPEHLPKEEAPRGR